MGRRAHRPPLVVTAEEVTEEHIQWTIDRFFNMRMLRPLEWDRISTGLLTPYFNQVFRKAAKNHVLDVLVERKVLKKTVEVHKRQRRSEKTTYYELTAEILDADTAQ